MLTNFIKGLLTFDPTKRLTAAEAAQHPYVVEIRFDSSESPVAQNKLLALEANMSPPSGNQIFRDIASSLFASLSPDDISSLLEGDGGLPKLERMAASIKGLEKLVSWKSRDDKGDNVFHRAVRNGSAAVTRFLITKLGGYLHVDEMNKLDDAPIHLVAARGDCESIEILAKAGADLNLQGAGGDNFEFLPTVIADELVELVVKDYREDGGRESALFIACQYGHLEAFNKLIDLKADINARTYPHSICLLHQAAWCNQREMAEVLLNRGIDVNTIGGKSKRTPLHSACVTNAVETAALLLSRGAEVNAAQVKSPKATALHLACSWSSPNMVLMLLNYGADVSMLDKSEANVLHYAVGNKLNALAIIEILLECGVSVNSRDRRGQTPQTAALAKCQFEIANYLATKGANLRLADPDLYLVTGKDGTKPAWHYALIDPEKLEVWKAMTESGNETVDVAEYGKVVRSGWGERPSKEIEKLVKMAYGYEDDEDDN